MGRQRREKRKQSWRKEWQKRRGTSTTFYGSGVKKGDYWCTGMNFHIQTTWIHSNFWDTVRVSWVQIKPPLFRICVHQSPHQQKARPVDCSEAEVGASLATKRVYQYSYNTHPDLLWPTVQHRAVQYVASVEMTSIIRYKFRRGQYRWDPPDSYISPLTLSRVSCMQLAYFFT